MVLWLASTMILSAERDVAQFDMALIRKAEARLDRRIAEGELAGAVTLVAHHGRVVSIHTSGYADLAKQKPMAKSTLFQVWSMTKPVTAAAVMVAVEDGLVNLDDPVEKYLPQFKGIKVVGGEAPTKRPTLRHLLTHTSGLSGDDPGNLSDEAKSKMTLAEYSRLIGTEPLAYQPGTAIRYSGVGINAAAAIVEKVSGTPFDAFVKNRIFQPLGMTHTFFFLPSERAPELAKTYTRGDNGKLMEFVHDAERKGAKFANGAGGLYSNVEDMARFLHAFRPGAARTILSPASMRLMTTLHTGDLLMDGGNERGYGLGWNFVRSPGGQMQMKSIGTFGHTGAFGTEYWLDPSTGVSVVFLVQGFGLSDEGRKSFSTMVNAAINQK